MSEAHTVPRVGVIGTGFGKWHAREIRRLETEGLCKLSALCRTNTKAGFEHVYDVMRKAGLPDHPVEEFYDHMSFFERGSIDAVVIASPARLHAEHARYALTMGLHAYVEKPFVWDGRRTPTQNLEEGNSILELAQHHDKAVAGGSQLAAWFADKDASAYRAAGRVMPENVRVLRIRHGTGRPNDASGRQTTIPEMLVDLLPHSYAMLRALAGSGTLSFQSLMPARTTTVSALVPFRQTDPDSPDQFTVSANYLRKSMEPVRLRVSLDKQAHSGSYLHFTINDQMFERVDEKGARYVVKLKRAGEPAVEVADPTYESVRNWIRTVRGDAHPTRNYSRSVLQDAHQMLCDTMNAYAQIKTM